MVSKHVYAILRIDAGFEGGSDPNLYVKAVKVYAIEADAIAEVQRLNTLNESRGSRYYLQSAKLVDPGPLQPDRSG